MDKAILLKNRPEGKPSESDFEFVDIEREKPEKGQVLLKTLYISVDPYLRGRMIDQKSYIEPFKLDEPIVSGIVSEVIESKHENFEVGDKVTGMLAWKEFQISNGKGLQKVDGSQAPHSAYLGILGMTGLTAYFGLTDIGQPKEGETLVVSGAAGAVGTVVGQIGKILGCNVIGIAGTDEKITMLKDKFGFDAAINYKTTKNMQAAIQEAAPDGVDVYFDNVGGDITDAVLSHINNNARIVACGAISLYNATEQPTGPRIETTLIKKSALIQGFTVGNYADQFGKGIKQLAQWLGEDKLTYSETVVEGFENTPSAFLDLFEGKNEGKMVVKV